MEGTPRGCHNLPQQLPSLYQAPIPQATLTSWQYSSMLCSTLVRLLTWRWGEYQGHPSALPCQAPSPGAAHPQQGGAEN